MSLAEHKFAILKIILFIIIFLVIYIYLLGKRYRSHIIANWTEYRKNPFFLPFAGFLRKDGEKRGFIDFTKNNFQAWFWTLSKDFFSYLIKPVQYILDIITKIIKSFTETLDAFRKQAKVIRQMFADIVTSTANKMTNSYTAIQFYQARLMDLTKRQQAMFQIILYVADSMRMTLASLINGPVIGMVQFLPWFGVALLILMAICILCALNIPFVSWVACPICLICFEETTPVTLENGLTKPISALTLTDRVAAGGQVISTMKFYLGNSPAEVYQYQDIIVSGSHLAFPNGQARRIADCPEAVLLEKNPEYLYCANTEKHRLEINNQLYGDFHECSDKVVNQLAMSFILDALNNKTEYGSEDNDQDNDKYMVNPNDPVYQWGIGKQTKIKMFDGKMKQIENIQIGDWVEGGGEVYGLIKHRADYLEVYQLPIRNKSGEFHLELSGTQAVKYAGSWSRVHQLSDSLKIKYTEKNVYQLATRNHLIITEDNIHLTDYLELEENHPVFDRIHKLNLESVSDRHNRHEF